MVSNYEKGKSNPRLPALLKLEEITGIPIYELCTESINPSRIPSAPLENYKPNSTGIGKGEGSKGEEVTDLKSQLIAADKEIIAALKAAAALKEEVMVLKIENIELKMKK